MAKQIVKDKMKNGDSISGTIEDMTNDTLTLNKDGVMIVIPIPEYLFSVIDNIGEGEKITIKKVDGDFEIETED